MAVKFLDGITVDGNVGIGNTNPSDYSADADNLVVGSLSGNNGITILSTASNGYGSIYFADSTTGNKVYSGFIRYQQNQSNMTFGTNEVERMRIDVNGNVGIGTISPAAKLAIGGSTRIMGNGSSNNSHALEFTNSAVVIARSSSNDLNLHAYNAMVFGVSNSAWPTSTERMRITSAGNIGIGTTTPSQKLEVNGAIQSNVGGRPVTLSSGQITIKGDTGGWALQYGFLGSSNAVLGGFGTLGGANSLSYFYIGPAYNSSNILVLKPSTGNVGIGTTTPDSKLEVIGNYKQKAADGNTQGFTLSINSSTDAVSLNNFYNASMTFSTNNSVKMTILGGGNVGIGTTSPSQKLEVVGKAKITTSLAVGAITPSATTGRIDASNDIVAFSSSDIRLKNNIKTIDKALDKVNSIQGIEFDWIEKEIIHGNKGRDVGVIAQEIEKILPEVVTTRDNGYKAVKYEKIVPILIEAIKDLSRQVDGLKRLI